jgi:hypothetical protein
VLAEGEGLEEKVLEEGERLEGETLKKRAGLDKG